MTTEPTPQELVAEVRVALGAATSAPWEFHPHGTYAGDGPTDFRIETEAAGDIIAVVQGYCPETCEIAQLIANAPTWLSQLCTALTAALDANREMEKDRNYWLTNALSWAEDAEKGIGYVTALRVIAQPRHGLQGIIEDGDDPLERAEYFMRQFFNSQEVARKALAQLLSTPPTGVSLRAELEELQEAALDQVSNCDHDCPACNRLADFFADKAVGKSQSVALAEAKAEVGRLRAVARSVEWAAHRPSNGHVCPLCRSHRTEGHRPDCVISAALADAATPKHTCTYCKTPIVYGDRISGQRRWTHATTKRSRCEGHPYNEAEPATPETEQGNG